MRARQQLVVFALVTAACSGGESAAPVGPTIAVNAPTLELRGLGSEASLAALVSPASATVTWTSEQPTVATISGSGASATVRAVAAGTATIVVSARVNGKQAEARAVITVIPIVRAIALAPSPARVVVGGTLAITPTVTADAGASALLVWSTSDPARASVSAMGLVTGLAPGNVTVTAASVATPTVSGQLQVVVEEAPKVRGITMTPNADSALIGQSRTFTAIVAADAGVSTSVVWRSSAPGVATVSSTGVATAVGAGVAFITVQSAVDSTIRATATFTARAPTVRSITVQAPTSMLVGTTGQATATVSADAGVSTGVTWTSSEPNVASVSTSGLITALSAGTAAIRATSTAVPAVFAAATLTVAEPPFFANWTKGRIGTVGNQVTDGLAQTLVSLDATTALATFQASLDGGSPRFRQALQQQQISETALPVGAQSLLYLTSVEPGVAFAADGPSVYRWSAATGWVKIAVDPPAPPTNVRALPGGRVAVSTRSGTSGSVHLWNGSAWATLFNASWTGNVFEPDLWMNSEAWAVYVVANSSVQTIYRWNGTTLATLPNIPGVTANDRPVFAGNSLTDLYALAAFANTRLYRWNGSSWAAMTAGLDANDPPISLTLCQGQPVVSTGLGRVYRYNGTAFARLGTDAEALPDRFVLNSFRPVSCASDGTLRTAAGEGSIARWTGSSWALESFSPSLSTVRVVSPTIAWASGGALSMYRWDGRTWTLAYRAVPGLAARVGSITSWSDGKLIAALWNTHLAPTTIGSVARGVLVYDGTTWRQDLGGILQHVAGVWGPRYDNTFAVGVDGRVLSFNGSTWQTAFTANGSLSFIDGVGSNYALAIGTDLRTVRWNGTSWSQVTTGTAGLTPTHFYVAAADQAWASVGQSMYRFNGTSWSLVDMSGAGGALFTQAIFGTGPDDVYALRLTASGDNVRLYRWNGAQWSQISAYPPGTLELGRAGAAVPGLAVVAGNAGLMVMSTTGAAPQGRPR